MIRDVIIDMILILSVSFLLFLTGCSTTTEAHIRAYGLHAITPYGILSLGYFEYDRKANGEEEKK